MDRAILEAHRDANKSNVIGTVAAEALDLLDEANRLRRSLGACASAAGIADAGDACRTIIAIATATLQNENYVVPEEHDIGVFKRTLRWVLKAWAHDNDPHIYQAPHGPLGEDYRRCRARLRGEACTLAGLNWETLREVSTK